MANRARKVRCIETGEVYNSYREAGKAIGVTATCISRAVSGRQENAKGLHFEAVEENVQEVGSFPVTVTNEQGELIPVLDSREVARMMGKEHWEILEYIEGKVKSNGQITGILPTLQGGQLISTDYFIESSYTVNNRKKRCSLCTKIGCDLLATRQIGEEGILVGAKDVERLNEREKELKSKSEHQHP